jgi:hypothetical protein
MYPAPRSEDFFGVLEMSPSGAVDSQYISSDSTAHIPKYMAGRCRFSVSSTVANMVLMAPSKNKKSIIVHEYQWDGDKKVQQAWHTWTFPYDVASAYFSGDTLHIVMINNGYAVGCAIDPAAGAVAESGIRRPFLDLYDIATIVDQVVTVPVWALQFDPAIEAKLTLVVASGATSGELVGSTAGDGVLNTVRSYPSGDVLFGIKYLSAWAPTPPLYRDYKDNVVSTNKLSLVRWIVGTEDSGEYQVSIKDDAMDEALVLDSATLYWSSVELDLGRDSLAEGSSAIVPCRTDAHTTTTVFSTNGVSEMNMVSLDHVLRTQQRTRRR